MPVLAAAAASHGTTLYQYKNWDVQLVTWDDGTSACVAEVYYDNGDSFSVWKYKDATTKLQFYSPSWNFGDNGAIPPTCRSRSTVVNPGT